MGGLFSRRRRENPALQAIQKQQEDQRRAEQAAREAREAQERAEAAQRELHRKAQEAAEASRLAEEARKEADRKAQMEREERERVEQQRAQAVRQAMEAEEKARMEREMAERERHAREQADNERRQAEEVAEMARLAKEEADKAAESARLEREKAEEAAKQAVQEAEQAKQNLKDGIQPLEWPTAEEYARTLRERQYQEGMFHFAIAGIAGSGKSSLINAFRGILNDTSGAAATGITETTLGIGRYPDPNTSRPFIWYDIPGAGTPKIKDWQYFNEQGLYIFDAILLLFDNRFTATDVAIIRSCARWQIPCFIVRSKSDTQIKNIQDTMMNKIEDDEALNEDERIDQLEGVESAALEKYTTETRESVKKNLVEAGLEHQRVYLISYRALWSVIKRKIRKDTLYLEEEDLIVDILKATEQRRCFTATQEDSAETYQSVKGIPSGINTIFAKLTNAVGFGGKEN